MMTASGPSLSATCASALRLSAAVMVVVSMILLQPSLFVTASDDGDHLNLTAVRYLVEGQHRHIRQMLAQKLKQRSAHKRRRNNCKCRAIRSEEHTSELQSLMRISYAVFCLKKKTQQK